MVRKKRKRIILGHTEETAALSCAKEDSSKKEAVDSEYEVWQSLTKCIRQAEAALDRMKAEDGRRADI